MRWLSRILGISIARKMTSCEVGVKKKEIHYVLRILLKAKEKFLNATRKAIFTKKIFESVENATR